MLSAPVALVTSRFCRIPFTSLAVVFMLNNFGLTTSMENVFLLVGAEQTVRKELIKQLHLCYWISRKRFFFIKKFLESSLGSIMTKTPLLCKRDHIEY